MAKKVGDLMTRDVVALAMEEDLLEADRLMRLERVRHLPVTRDGRLVGLVSHRDLLRAQARMIASIGAGEDGPSHPDGKQLISALASDIMTSEVAIVSPDAPASEAARLLLEEKIGCLPVVSDGRLVGIVTEADFLEWAMLELEQHGND